MNRKGRKIDDCLYFKSIDSNAFFGHHETQDSTRFDAEDTLMRVQPNIIVLTMNKYGSEVFRVISTFHGMSRKVVEVWLNYVFDVMKIIIHFHLECGPNVL